MSSNGPVSKIDKRLVLRSSVEPGKIYGEYRQTLRKDFFYSCAYCSMTEFEAQGIRMTIDHFYPRNARSDLVNDYSNLMYSCGTCNERKGDRCPPADAENAGHRFFRPDVDARSDHFELDGSAVKSKSTVGEFTIQYADLNRDHLLKLRELRNRITKCLPLVTEGIMALREFQIDQLPAYIRTRAHSHIGKTIDMAERLDRDVDEVLLDFARSEMIDPDERSEERSADRTEYTKGLNALFPGRSFRAPRRKKHR